MKQIMMLAFMFVGMATAQAGEFYEKNGFALGGYDAITFFEVSGPKQGSESINAKYKDSIFLFSSEDHKNEFLKNPEKFSPKYNGFCAFGLAGGYKAKTEPEAYSVVNGNLYFNYDLSVQKKWLQNRDSSIEKADANWPSVKSSTRVYY